MSCRFRWWAKWVMNRVPRDESPALGAGKLLHLIFEDYHTGARKTLASAADHRLAQWREAADDGALSQRERDAGDKAIKVIEDLAEALQYWKDTFEFQVPVIEVEQPFEIEFDQCPNVVFRGRPDRAALGDGLVWHVQNRGLAASTNFATYTQLAKRHYHEHLYAEHLARKYPKGTRFGKYRVRGYGGTFFNLVRKLKFRTYAGTKREEVKTPAEMFWQHPMTVKLDSGLHRHVMECLFDHVRAMREAEDLWHKQEIIPPPNEKMNGGFNGNVIDPYFRVLTGEITLEDDAYFKAREDTYAQTALED